MNCFVLIVLSCSLLISADTTSSQCTPAQMYTIYGNCISNLRNISYIAKPNEYCISPSTAETNCECTDDEYQVDLGECIEGQQTATYTKITSCVGTKDSTQQTCKRPCTIDDITVFTTKCAYEHYLYTFNYNDDCTPTGDKDIPSYNASTCGRVCPEGTYFDIETKQCENCAPGYRTAKYSKIYNDWTTLPPEFVTVGPSAYWRTDGRFLTTGKCPPSHTETLNLTVDIVLTEGRVTFTYEVPNGNAYGEYIEFFIDGKRDYNSYAAATWTTLSFIIPYGKHVLTWYVNTYYYEGNKFEDTVHIREIIVEGQEFLALACELCPVGQTSVGGVCQRCPANTFYSNENGVISCKNCSNNEYSLPGSTVCSPRIPCTSSHYDYVEGACGADGAGAGKYKKSWKWIEPIVCDTESSNILPPTTVHQCPPCDMGMHRTGGTGPCVKCPPGYFRAGKGGVEDQCQPCPGGSIPRSDLFISYVDNIRTLFNTSCHSDDGDDTGCATDGWRARDGKFESGNHHPRPGQTRLELNTDGLTSYWSEVHFKYETHLQPKSLFKVRAPDETLLTIDHTANGVEHSDYVKPGWYSPLTFLVIHGRNYSILDEPTSPSKSPNSEKRGMVLGHKQENSDDTSQFLDDYVMIWDIYVVEGESTDLHNGATRCEQCPAGTFAPPGSLACQTCPPGTFSDKNAAMCTTCPEGSIAPDEKSINCTKCLGGTVSSTDRTTCEFSFCGVAVNESFVIDLSPLTIKYDAEDPDFEGKLYGPMGTSDFLTQYFINVCSKDFSNVTCKGVDSYACSLTSSGGTSLGSQIGFEYWERVDKVPINTTTALSARSVSPKTLRAAQAGIKRTRAHSLRRVANDEDDEPEPGTDPEPETVDELHYGVNVTYWYGKSGYIGPTPVRWGARIEFECEPESAPGQPMSWFNISIFQDSNGTYNFRWPTAYACRHCTAEDYERVPGECANGSRHVSYDLHAHALCFGAVELPTDETEECPIAQVSVSSGALFGIIAAVVVFLLALAVVVFCIARANRRMSFRLFNSAKMEGASRPPPQGVGPDVAPSYGTDGLGGEESG